MYALKLLLKNSFKSKKIAKIYYDEGNNFFSQQKYFEALISYNKSLCHAELDSIDQVNGFAGRSAVYFKIQFYDKCLDNIKLAYVQSRYKIDTNLVDREHRCNEIIKHCNIVRPKDICKPSYTPHPKIPFIASCLELDENEKFGRFIKTNCNLRPGDVIAIEEPVLRFIDLQMVNFFKYQLCFNCLKSNKLSLLPGPHSVMSCSQACYDATAEKDIATETFIQSELDWKIMKMIRIKNDSEKIAGNFEKLESLFNSDSRTIFDFDLRDTHKNESRKLLFKCAISLGGGSKDEKDRAIEIFELMLSSYNKQHRAFFIQFVDHLMNICRTTQFSLNIFDELAARFEKIGNCLLPFGGLLNHSCDPNVFWIPCEGKFVFIVAKPISANEQLFICYRKSFLCESRANRQRELVNQYGFNCECPACTDDFRSNKQFQASPIHSTNYNKIRDEIEKNWREIERNTQLPYKTAEIIAKNKILLEYVTSKFML